MDNNNGAEWCRHIKGLVLALDIEIEINLILTLEMVLHLSDLHYQSTGI